MRSFGTVVSTCFPRKVEQAVDRCSLRSLRTLGGGGKKKHLLVAFCKDEIFQCSENPFLEFGWRCSLRNFTMKKFGFPGKG